MSDLPPQQTVIDLNEQVRASVVDAATGILLRVIDCPRHALSMQVGTGETLVERVLGHGKRWDAATEQEVDADPPPPPSEDAIEFDPVAWRWIAKGEKNAPFVFRMELLERAQNRTVREFLLGDMTQAEARARLRIIDNAIIDLRNQLIP